MNRKHYLSNIITTLVIVMIILLAGYILLDDIEGFKNRRETEKENVSPSNNETKSAFAGSMDETYYMVVFKKETYYWEGVKQGFDLAGRQLGVRTLFEGSEEYDVNAQLKVFEKVVAKKPKGIAVHPICADSFVEPINDAIEKGIMVTTFAADSPESKRLTWVTSDNVKEGIYAADFIAEVLGGEGEIGIIERPSQSNHAKRVEAFMQRLEEAYPDLKVVARGTADGDEAKAARLAVKMIEENPGLDFIYCVAGIEGMGAGAGVKEAGSNVKVFTYDADPPVIDMVKEGTIYAVIQPNVINQGYWSLLSLYIAAHNLLDPISDWKVAGKSPLPAMIDNGMDIVTKENGDYFYVYD
ncbi:MAG: sugar ABC transporter substrate-binding protein [Clostridiales bacterium]|nr:sugar ABC transporter substrate-binding protein [Clostridiales bacterium]